MYSSEYVLKSMMFKLKPKHNAIFYARVLPSRVYLAQDLLRIDPAQSIFYLLYLLGDILEVLSWKSNRIFPYNHKYRLCMNTCMLILSKYFWFSSVQAVVNMNLLYVVIIFSIFNHVVISVSSGYCTPKAIFNLCYDN